MTTVTAETTSQTQSQRAEFAAAPAASADDGNPVSTPPHSLSTTFFAEGERKEREGWDWSDLATLVPPPGSTDWDFDRVPRRRLSWLWGVSLAAATAVVTMCVM
jgi:hypothetical protein